MPFKCNAAEMLLKSKDGLDNQATHTPMMQQYCLKPLKHVCFQTHRNKLSNTLAPHSAHQGRETCGRQAEY